MPSLALAAISAVLTAFVLAGPLHAEERTLSGQVTYLARMALGPDASLVVEAADPDGRILARRVTATGGAQVPLPFSLAVPGAADLVLRGAIRVGGEMLWLTESLPVAPGTEDADLGEILAQPFRDLGFATAYQCSETTVSIRFTDAGAHLRSGGAYVDLVPVPAASGAKYADPQDEGTWVWSKGEEISLSLRGGEPLSCTPALPSGAPVHVTGNEPGWRIVLDGTGATLTRMGGDARQFVVSEAGTTPTGIRIALDGGAAVLTLHDALCRDDATGMPYPLRAVLTLGEELLDGCGGDPMALIAGIDWHVAAVTGLILPDGVGATLRFSPDGRVSGRFFCNRFMGEATLTGEGLSFGRLAGTMMACGQPAMDAERASLDALATVTRFDFDDAGRLILYAGDSQVVTLALQ
jgi:heat shock protein HslJ/uncharacterized lipoprotein YbaY